ncbi:MAG: hypothetical protein QOF30_1728 [Acidimicrobiaceae bacterium]|jgi:uncharacterized protein YecE (DUF72 family)|nr:hypothetical protein [Acidimicrobiaceae bacterium]
MTETLLTLGLTDLSSSTRAGGPRSPVPVDGSLFLCGASSWADQGLVRHGDFYPRKTMTATERLAYYCSRLPLAEISTTYRFPPTPDLARQWVARTPPGFCFDVRAWSLLTEAPTLPDSLWEDLQGEVRPETRNRRRLYSAHLGGDAIDECWRRFEHALRPLHTAGRLGVVILQYPSWFTPKAETRSALVAARQRLADYRVAVDFRSPKWLVGAVCEDTLEWLEAHDIGFVCTDGPLAGPRAMPSVMAATSDVAVVRFVGRRAIEDDPWPWPYRYSDPELADVALRVRELAASTSEVHLIMENCWRGDAVANALTLATLLEAPVRG